MSKRKTKKTLGYVQDNSWKEKERKNRERESLIMCERYEKTGRHKELRDV